LPANPSLEVKIDNLSFKGQIDFLPYYLWKMKRILAFILSVPVHFYRYLIGPLLPRVCRHVPSCSQYMLDALRIHGPFTGFAMGTNRILRCRPGGTHGFDPVPLFRFRRYKPLIRFPKSNRLKHGLHD